MAVGKRRKVGRSIQEIQLGEKLVLSEKIVDRDLLLYLGLTDDNNPLFIQHDYASLTPYKKPIVPQIMLIGMMTSGISKILPGSGSAVLGTRLSFSQPVYHYETVTFLLEVIEVNMEHHRVTLQVSAMNEENKQVLAGEIDVAPPYPQENITSRTFDNF